jgi:hypothetical protein
MFAVFLGIIRETLAPFQSLASFNSRSNGPNVISGFVLWHGVKTRNRQ